MFLSERHRDALAHLLYGIGQGGSGGFVQLTGEVGTGKTTLCRLLLEQLPENARVALVLNPKLTPVELLETICEELHLDVADARGSLKALVDALNHYLLDAYAQGLRVVLIIDEAQNLSRRGARAGAPADQPRDADAEAAADHAARPAGAARRCSRARPAPARAAHHRALSPDAAATRRNRRLPAPSRARRRRQRFPVRRGSAVRRMHALSGGVPRLFNMLAERALLAGYVHGRQRIDASLVDQAAAEVLPSAQREPMGWRILGWSLVLAGAGSLWLALWSQGVL